MESAILITVRYTAKGGMRKEFYREIMESGVVDVFRREEGCLKYDYYFPADSEDDLCLFEMWSSLEAQRAHSQTEDFKKLGQLKEKYILRTELKFYRAEPVKRD